MLYFSLGYVKNNQNIFWEMKNNKTKSATVTPQNALSHNEGKYISKPKRISQLFFVQEVHLGVPGQYTQIMSTTVYNRIKKCYNVKVKQL